MKTPAAPRHPHHPGFTDTQALRHRAELPAIRTLLRGPYARMAEHDFLVPNPRPDLTCDARTLRMLEAG
jgi:hypothetical protein